MEHGGNAQKGWAIFAAVLGSAALVAYSIAGAFQTLVWNPLAAVPGATLGEIHGAMTEAGESLGAPRVIGWSAVGIAVAAAGMIGTGCSVSRRTLRLLTAWSAGALVAASASGCGATPSGNGEPPCFPPAFSVAPLSARPGETVTVMAPDADCNPRYGGNARIQVAMRDASGVEVFAATAPDE